MAGRKRFLFFVFFMILIGLAAGCLFSPVFNIVEVRTNDGENVTSGEILEKANVPIGENIFRINDKKILSSIETLPYIKVAKIYRAFPDTIILKYEERKPYAIVKYLESYAIVDKYGYILEIQKENTFLDLPIIYGLDTGKFVLGEKLTGTSYTKYENCVYLFETASRINFEYTFDEINYDDLANVKLYIASNDIDIVYGNIYLDEIEEKLNCLSSVIKRLNTQKGKIDISNDDYLSKTVFTEKK